MIPHKFEMAYNCDHCKAPNTLDLDKKDFDTWVVDGCPCCTGPTVHIQIDHRCQVCNKMNTYIILEG